jgi:hypothetical protein
MGCNPTWRLQGLLPGRRGKHLDRVTVHPMDTVLATSAETIRTHTLRMAQERLKSMAGAVKLDIAAALPAADTEAAIIRKLPFSNFAPAF